MGLGSINKTMRTTAFKLSAIYLIIFTIFAIFLIVYIAINTQILMDPATQFHHQCRGAWSGGAVSLWRHEIPH